MQNCLYRLVADRCLSRVRWRRGRQLWSLAAGWTSVAWFLCSWDVSSMGEHPTAAGLCRWWSRECWCVETAARSSLGVLAAQFSWVSVTALWSRLLPHASMSKMTSRFPHGVHGADIGLLPLWASFGLKECIAWALHTFWQILHTPGHFASKQNTHYKKYCYKLACLFQCLANIWWQHY